MASPNSAITNTAPAAKAGAKVCLASKLPNGIILRGHEKKTITYGRSDGSTVDVVEYRPTGETYEVAGAAVRMGEVPLQTYEGYRITTNIPKDFWDTWSEMNKASPLIKSQIIFACETEHDAMSRAVEISSSVRTGFEGIEPRRPDLHLPKQFGGKIERFDANRKG